MVMSAQNAEGGQETSENHLDQGHYRLLEKDILDRNNEEKTPL